MKTMEHKQKTALFISLGLMVIFGAVLFVTHYFEAKKGQRLIKEDTAKSQSSVVNMPIVEKKLDKELLVIDEPLENWKQCRNLKVGYEMRYPSDWKTYHSGPWGNIPEQCGATLNPEFVISPEDEFNVEKANFRVVYLDVSDLGVHSLDEYLQKNSNYLDEKFRETLIQGNRAIWTKGNNGYTNVLTYNNNKVFIVKVKNITIDSFEKFLSTFKFLM